MATPFIGELKIVSFGFAPRGWAMANGQLLPINQNQALFSLLGTTYGGNGQTTFALPNMQGRTPMHFGTGPAGSVVQGEIAGEEQRGGREHGTRRKQLRQCGDAAVSKQPGAVRFDGPAVDGRGREPAACESAALSDDKFRHRSGRRLPQPELKANEPTLHR